MDVDAKHSNDFGDHNRFDQINAIAVFEATPSPYLLLKPDFTIVGVNDAYLRATSTVRKQIVGRGIFDVFPDNPNDPNATGVRNLRASLKRVRNTKRPDRMSIQKYDIPMPGSTKGEFEERYWSPLNVPVLGDHGELIYIIHHVEDVTETVKVKTQYTELEKSEAHFRQIANAMPQIVWSARPDGYHDYFNDRFYEWTGLPYNSSYGEKWIGLVHPDDQEKLWNAWRQSLKTGNSYEIEYRIRYRTGEYRWILARALPIRNQAGRLIRWIGTTTDIQEQKRAQEVLNEVLQSREEFFSIASHELRTPISTALLQAQIYLKQLENETSDVTSKDLCQNAMKIVERQARVLARLVEEMLDISRIRSGMLTLERKSCNLCDLLKDVLQQMESQFQAADSPVPILEVCEPAWGEYDPPRIEQVINNMLTNAIRYGMKKPVKVRLETFGTKTRLSVQDGGIGIPKESLHSIFDRFKRATKTGATKGLGLGLYISKRIIEAHGGKIWAESELGHGSTFYIELPISHHGS